MLDVIKSCLLNSGCKNYIMYLYSTDKAWAVTGDTLHHPLLIMSCVPSHIVWQSKVPLCIGNGTKVG